MLNQLWVDLHSTHPKPAACRTKSPLSRSHIQPSYILVEVCRERLNGPLDACRSACSRRATRLPADGRAILSSALMPPTPAAARGPATPPVGPAHVPPAIQEPAAMSSWGPAEATPLPPRRQPRLARRSAARQAWSTSPETAARQVTFLSLSFYPFSSLK